MLIGPLCMRLKIWCCLEFLSKRLQHIRSQRSICGTSQTITRCGHWLIKKLNHHQMSVMHAANQVVHEIFKAEKRGRHGVGASSRYLNHAHMLYSVVSFFPASYPSWHLKDYQTAALFICYRYQIRKELVTYPCLHVLPSLQPLHQLKQRIYRR